MPVLIFVLLTIVPSYGAFVVAPHLFAGHHEYNSLYMALVILLYVKSISSVLKEKVDDQVSQIDTISFKPSENLLLSAGSGFIFTVSMVSALDQFGSLATPWILVLWGMTLICVGLKRGPVNGWETGLYMENKP